MRYLKAFWNGVCEYCAYMIPIASGIVAAYAVACGIIYAVFEWLNNRNS